MIDATLWVIHPRVTNREHLSRTNALVTRVFEKFPQTPAHSFQGRARKLALAADRPRRRAELIGKRSQTTAVGEALVLGHGAGLFRDLCAVSHRIHRYPQQVDV